MQAIEPIGAALTAVSQPSSSTLTNAGVDFAQMLDQGMGQLDGQLKIADEKLRVMAAGGDVPVHDVMISLEEARMSLTLMVEIRNRAVEAYQELMRMQL